MERGCLKLVNLTNEQKQAVVTLSGNVVCIASAGSGKTSAFTTRIAYMIKKGIKPSNIMAITFTKKASIEMIGRLSKLVGKDLANQVVIGTTHSVFLRILKKEDAVFQKRTIIPDWDRFAKCKEICEPFDEKNNPNGLNVGIKPSQLAGFISYQKSNLVRPNDPLIFDEVTSYVSPLDEEILRQAYIKYERLKANTRQVDFDDMLMYMHDKLKLDEAFRIKLAGQFQYVMIDEFQDSSMVVSEIVKMINNKNVFVVGDFRQSIYSFMNSKVENILEFHKNFDNVTTIELNKNFRSTQKIVEFSNDIISLSPIDSYRNYKMSESVSEEGSPVRLTAYQDAYIQIEGISQIIQQKLSEGTPLSEIAVLVRTNAQTGMLEEKLSNLDIPYELSKTASFFDKREVMDILAYLKLATDFHDNESFRRVYNAPNRYLSKASLETLESEATENDISLWTATSTSSLNDNWAFRKNIKSLINVVVQANEMLLDGDNLGSVVRFIIQATNYKKFIHDTTPTHAVAVDKEESIKRVAEMASRFPSAQAFLTNISIIKEKQKKAKDGDTVKISTIHSAKGLEWDVVFVIDVNLDLLPHAFNGDIEEERRLFYVACSRPRKELYVSWSVYEVGSQDIVGDSLFIKEMVGAETLKKMKGDLFGKPSVSIDYTK